MSKYRDRLQIIANILTIASKKAKKTQIMYQANLSYKLLCRYLGEVLDADLVSFDKHEGYVLTNKGKDFLSRHKEYSKRCQTLEEHLNSVNNEKTALEKMTVGPNMTNNESDPPGTNRRSKRKTR